MPHRALGPGREFDLIRRIAGTLGDRARELGDDCAVIPEGPGQLVTSLDSAVEGVHFRREWLTHEEIGYRACAGALSDLAAAAATPAGLLVALTLPAGVTEEEVAALMAGVGRAGDWAGAPLLGGDLSAGPVLSLCVSVFGWAARVPGRGGAGVGDGVWVTGELGGARAALECWERKLEPDPASRAAFAHPTPRIGAGRWLEAHGATAMLDLSDGLAGDARHLAAASGVRVEVDLSRIPRHPGVDQASALAGERAEVFAARGGEDYELLVTLPSSFGESDCTAFQAANRLRLTRIGDVSEGAGARLLLEGAEVPVVGYDHFA